MKQNKNKEESIILLQSPTTKGYWITLIFLTFHVWFIGLSIAFFDITLFKFVLIPLIILTLWIIDGIIIQVYLNSDFYKNLGKIK